MARRLTEHEKLMRKVQGSVLCVICGKSKAKHSYKTLRCPYGRQVVLKTRSHGINVGDKGYEGYLIGQYFIPPEKYIREGRNCRVVADSKNNKIEFYDFHYGTLFFRCPYDPMVISFRIMKSTYYARIWFKKLEPTEFKDVKFIKRRARPWDGYERGE